MALNARTVDFYKNAKLENRKKFGQYMTPFSCVEKVISGIKFNKSDKVLEPSYGSGQFMDKLIQNKSISINNICGVELDSELFKLSKDVYKGCNLFNSNYLTQKFNTKFNVIIGNPPYFEIDDEFPSDLKKQFSDVVCGRPNIYSFFIKKGIDELADGGLLAFVIPTSLLSSKYFEKIREYIIKYCDIELIIKLTSDLFEDALQKTMIFQIRKRKSGVVGDNKFIVSIGGGKIFSPDWVELNKYLVGKRYIIDLGCSVKTGNIVWNQFMDKHKDKFLNDSKSDGKDNIPLIYPRNLKNGKITFIKDDKKPQYIKYNADIKPIFGPIIAINRIVGLDSVSLHPVLIETGKYFFENHINVITGSIDNLRLIEKSLSNSKTIEFIKKIIGNTQLSKTELETMIPIEVEEVEEKEVEEKEVEDTDSEYQLDEDEFNKYMDSD
jgi:adenine-specific DNA-methyltransferase